MSPFSKYFHSAICFTAISLSSSLFSVVIPVKDGEELNFALENGLSPLTIEFQNDIRGGTPSQNFVFPVNSDSKFAVDDKMVTINGNGFSLSPPSSNSGISIPRGLFIHGGTVTINNLFISTTATGGSSLGRGGGGAGLGGGLFIEEGSTVNLVNPIFSSCKAIGGSSNTFENSGSGGGGLGNYSPSGASSGGGGLFQIGGFSLIREGGGGGAGVGFPGGNTNDAGAAAGGGTFDGSNGGSPPGGDATGPGGGGAGGSSPGGKGGNGEAGGGGGGGGGAATTTSGDGGDGGVGGDFGGGGAGGSTADPNANAGNGGDGGFGGGGGGSGGIAGIGDGGTGGFGGGGGGATSTIGLKGLEGIGGHGGGNGGGNGVGGGGGAGFGGAIFMQKGATLNITTEGEFIPINLFQKNQAVGGRGFQNGLGEGPDIYMMASCLLTFDLQTDVFMSNPIVGDQGAGGGSTATGGLTKSGTALLVLKGPNTFTGTTTVDGGELHVDGSLLTPVTVNAGGVFSGTNTIQGDLMNLGGIVSPGATMPIDPAKLIGSITMTGEFTQNATGKLRTDLTPQGEGSADIHDKVIGASKANLAGTLEVVLDPGNYIIGTTYEVIDAPTNGTVFDTVTCTGDFCSKVELDLAYSSVIITLKNSVLFEHQFIDSGVASDVASSIVLNPINPRSDFALMVETLGTLNNKEVNEALVDISAIRFGALEWINARNNSYAADILSQHLFELCCSPRDCCSCDCDGDVWVSVFGNFMDNTKRYDDLPKFSANAGGLLVGLDYCSDNFYYGGAFGYTYTHLIWRDDGGSGKINSYYGALYGSWLCDCFSVDLSVLGGGSDNDLDRRVNFGAVHRTAESDYWGYFVTAHLGLRGSWSWCDNVIEPFAVADYHYYTHETFTEKGADSLSLRVKSNDQHIMRAEAGILSYREFTCECFCYAPYIGVSWVGEFPLHKSVQSASFVGQPGAVHNPTSYDSSVHLGAPQAGMKITSEDGVSLTIGYKGLFNDKTRINEAEVRFDWIF